MFEMMQVEEKKYFFMEYDEVDELIEGMYQGFDAYNDTYALEKGNDTIYREYFDSDEMFAKWASADITEWFEDEGTSTPSAETFMKELAYFGVIPPGVYIIEVSW
jgi:hypothetical protein